MGALIYLDAVAFGALLGGKGTLLPAITWHLLCAEHFPERGTAWLMAASTPVTFALRLSLALYLGSLT